MAAAKYEETVCPTNWKWQMFTHLSHQPIIWNKISSLRWPKASI